MPTQWLLLIFAMFLALGYGLIWWQGAAIERAYVFMSEVKVELRKVTWPGRQEVISTTSVVLVTVFFFGIYLTAIDAAVGWARLALFSAVGIGSGSGL